MSEEESEREGEGGEEGGEQPIQRRLLSLGEDGAVRRRAQAVIDLRRVTVNRRFLWQERGPWTLATKATDTTWMGSRPVAGLVMDVAVDGDIIVIGTAEGGV